MGLVEQDPPRIWAALQDGRHQRCAHARSDTYLMIIHDWSDAEAIQILRNCRQAMTDSGRILVCDAGITPSNTPDPAKMGGSQYARARDGPRVHRV
jgi:hypothetical protein